MRTCWGAPGVTSGSGLLMFWSGAWVASIAEGCGWGVAGGALGGAVRGAALGTGVCGAALGAGVAGRRLGTTVGTAAATIWAGALVGTAGGTGAGVTLSCACVGTGLGSDELTGAGVGLGGALGAVFASSCSTRWCGGADRGSAANRGRGTTGACGTGTVTGVGFAGVRTFGAARVTVTTTLPGIASGDACSDEDVASENKR